MLPRMHGDEDKSNELFEEVERRAYMDLPEEDGEDDVDLIASIEPVEPSEAKDLTLGGYIKLHNRPPAFSGTDDQPYTVDIDVEPTDDAQRPYAAFLYLSAGPKPGPASCNTWNQTTSPSVIHRTRPATRRSS